MQFGSASASVKVSSAAELGAAARTEPGRASPAEPELRSQLENQLLVSVNEQLPDVPTAPMILIRRQKKVQTGCWLHVYLFMCLMFFLLNIEVKCHVLTLQPTAAINKLSFNK